ncbi:MAG: crotonase/enoyl-CoA hydratase family protein [Pseudomonadota bacterium]
MTIECAREAGVQTIRFNRPEKKNAITSAMYDALADAIESGDASDDVAVHLFVGRDGSFTAGNDIGEFLTFASEGALGKPVLRFLHALATARKPLVSAVDGLAIGVGATMLFHCDLVYATERSVFHTPFLDLGLVPEAASSLLFPRVMGYQRAFEMLCLGKRYPAERACAAGFVNEIVAPEDLEPYARQAALQLATKPPEALAMARALVRGKSDKTCARIDEEAVLFADRLASQEAREAFTAFIEKRPASFQKPR